jgi:maltose O-acetyltransferase
MCLTKPPEALERLRRGLGVVRALVLFRGAEIGRLVNATGRVRVIAGGRISVGHHVQFLGGMVATEIICHPGAELCIGACSGFNYGVMIDCKERIHIGKRCLFGSMTRLRDSDPMRHGPIVIDDDVWLAHGAVIQPGVHIGAGSIVSAGSVVDVDVPPDSIAIGDPAESFPLGTDMKKKRPAFLELSEQP